MIRILASIFLLLFLSVSVNATPSQPTVSGTVTHNGIVTLSGSGFGTKARPAPKKWDPVDGLYTGITNGGVVPVGTGYPWKSTEGGIATHFKTTNPRGKWTAKYTNTGSTNAYKKATLQEPYPLDSSANFVYVTWWLWQDGTNACNSSNKWNRIYANGKQDTTDNGVAWEPDSVPFRNYTTSPITAVNWWGATSCTGSGAWKRMEEYIDSRNFPAASTIYLAIDNVPKYSTPKAAPIIFEHPVAYMYLIGFDGVATLADSQPTVDFGEIYIDDTPSRVEICDNENKSSATHCEIQIPQNTWTTSSIQIKVNQGSFSDGSTAYLIVVDSNNVAGPGRAVTFDGSIPVVNGACSTLPAAVNVCPSSGLCDDGTPSAVTQNSSTCTYTCVGSGGGTTDSCSVPFSVASGDPAVFTISATTPVTEGNPVTVYITRSGNLSGSGLVRIGTTGVTASGTLDYYGTNGEDILFIDGQETAAYTIATWLDGLTEPAETFTVNILSTSGTTGSPSSATVTINDSDNTLPPDDFPATAVSSSGAGTHVISINTGTPVYVH